MTTEEGRSKPPMHPILGYLVSAVLASLVYVAWLGLWISASEPPRAHSGLVFDFVFALFMCIFEGFGLALVLMIAPWVLFVRLYRLMRIPGWIYFSALGAVSLAPIACATASLAPKPLFVEDQTFLQGFMIAVERQGACLLAAGFFFGRTYWFLSGRERT